MISKITPQRILTLISYLQRQAKNTHSKDKLWLLKMIYLSDRYSLRKHGQPVSQDVYYAMKQGPVASLTFDVINKKENGFSKLERELIRSNVTVLETSQEKPIRIKSEYYAEDDLSETDKESLDFALNTFGKFTGSQLSGISHDYPEWRIFKTRFENNEKGRENIDMKLFFENPDLKVSHFLKKHLNGTDPYYEADEEYLQEMCNAFLGAP